MFSADSIEAGTSLPELEAEHIPEFFRTFHRHLPDRLWELHRELAGRLEAASPTGWQG
jgi:hypothetical protein